MRLKNLAGSVTVGAALFAVASSASAQGRGNGVPMNYIDRPLTMPAGTLVPSLEYDVDHTSSPTVAATGNGTARSSSTYTHSFNVGATIGLAPNFEFQSTFLPVEVSPNRQYGSPEFAATLRLARGQQELGARLGLTLNTVPVVTYRKEGNALVKETGLKVESATFEPGLPIILRFQHKARIDTGIFADITTGKSVETDVGNTTIKSPKTVVGVKLPIDLSIATAKNAYLGIGSGFQIDDLRQSEASFSMPLKLYAGFSVGTRRHPYLDIVPYFSWDHLITPGQSKDTNEVQYGTSAGAVPAEGTKIVQPTTATTSGPQETFHWDAWQFGLQLRGYMHFM